MPDEAQEDPDELATDDVPDGVDAPDLADLEQSAQLFRDLDASTG